MEETGKNNANKKGCGLLGILTLVLVLYWLWPASSSLEGKAWVISKDIVRARLVAPYGFLWII